ncbi:MAG: MerR family transcriptional regulator [Nitrospiraceae bacterium]|nr:MerR family transcriptional regulator [Nitrospiraceae bacterium]
MPGKGKRYYRIGEVSKLVGVEPHVLRYWESEFPQIRTHRVARQRLYRKKDIDLIKYIKALLYDKGFTIAGAKRELTEGQKAATRPCLQDRAFRLLMEIRQELIAIRDIFDTTNDG